MVESFTRFFSGEYAVLSLAKDRFLNRIGTVPYAIKSYTPGAIDLGRKEGLFDVWSALNPKARGAGANPPTTLVLYRVVDGRLEVDRERSKESWATRARQASDEIKTLRAGVAKTPDAETQPTLDDPGINLMRAILTKYLNERMLLGAERALAAFRADLRDFDDTFFYYNVGRNGRTVTCRYPISKIEPIVLASHDSIPDPFSVHPAAAHFHPVCQLRVDAPAFTYSPIWVTANFGKDADSAFLRSELRYPFSAYPQHFGYFDLELRRDGAAVEPIDTSNTGYLWAFVGGGPPSSTAPDGSPEGRLPLHLRYRIDKPGRYEVRLSAHSRYFGLTTMGDLVYQTDWIAFDVNESDYASRTARLDASRKSAPSDPGLLVGDYLPNLLAAPDSAAFATLVPYLTHTDVHVREYASQALALVDEGALCDGVVRALAGKSALPWLADFAQRRPAALALHAGEIGEMLITRLGWGEPAAYAADVRTLTALRVALPGGRALFTPELCGRCDAAVRESASRVEASADVPALTSLAQYAASTRFAGAGELLWRLADSSALKDQALMFIAILGRAEDLPKLTDALCANTKNSFALLSQINVVSGATAAPFLKKAMAEAASPETRFVCALLLARTNEPSALRFLKEAVTAPDTQKAMGALDQVTDALSPGFTRLPQPGQPSQYIGDMDERRRRTMEILDQKLEQTALSRALPSSGKG